LFPDATPGESEAVAVVFESAKAGLAYRDMMPVAAAARTTPLLRFCRTLVVFLLGEVRKPALGPRGGPKPAVAQPEAAEVPKRQ
jgi:hypothetical protein